MHDDHVGLRGVLPGRLGVWALSVSFSTDEKATQLFVGWANGIVSCFVWSTKLELWAVNCFEAPIWVIRQLDDKTMAAGTSSGKVVILDVAHGMQVWMRHCSHFVPGPSGERRCMANVSVRLVVVNGAQSDHLCPLPLHAVDSTLRILRSWK